MKGHPPTPNSLELALSPVLLHPSSGCRLAAQYGISTALMCRGRGAPGLVFAGGRMLLAPGGALVLDCSIVEGLSVPGWYPWGRGEAVAVCMRLLCQAGAQSSAGRQEGAAGVQGSDCVGSGCGCEGVCLGPRARWSPQFKLSMVYAGETWLEETEETSVLLWDTAEETSSSPKGFLPQQIVVIMQLRN